MLISDYHYFSVSYCNSVCALVATLLFAFLYICVCLCRKCKGCYGKSVESKCSEAFTYHLLSCTCGFVGVANVRVAVTEVLR